ncbi:MAG: ferritin [Anaerolineaceae bacterium]|nr:ferritin [Anaerolineaceae bacterium]
MNKKVLDAINEQIKNELFSGYLYLSMSAWFETQNLPGMAKWMRAQASEEQEHAMKFFDYVNERGGKVELKAIDQPQGEYDSALQVFEMSLAHEKYITGLINQLYELALAEKDYPAQILLQWYIKEQVEEEDNVGKAVKMLKSIDGKSYQLLTLDGKFGARG